MDMPARSELAQTHEVLVQLARGRFGHIAPETMLRLAEWSVRDVLADAGMKAVFFTGAESTKLRERSIIELHDDEATTMMFLSDAGGVGLNLQRAATCCINLELPWNPAVLEQRIGRIYRLGQTQPIDVYNLVSEEGIEARIAGLVAQKQAVFTSLFDGTTDEVRFEGDASFLASVKSLVEPLPPVVVAGASEIDDADEDGVSAIEASAEATAVQPGEKLGGDESPPGLSVERLADGRLRIEAPAELAGPLASLFEQLASALRSK